jgi:hypothetical protein
MGQSPTRHSLRLCRYGDGATQTTSSGSSSEGFRSSSGGWTR